MDRIIIFGASSGAVKVFHTIQNIGLDIAYFVDNDSAKHGKTLENRLIQSPASLKAEAKGYKIIIASIYHEEIEKQLADMGVAKENIILKEEYLLRYIDEHAKELSRCIYEHSIMPGRYKDDHTKELCRYSDDKAKDLCKYTDDQPKAFYRYSEIIEYCKVKQTRNILIDLADGLVLGGIERWSIDIAEGLADKGRKVTLLANNEVTNITGRCQGILKRFDLSFERYMQSVVELAEEMISQLPCTVIVNKINQMYMAAYLVRKIFGDELKILSVLHSDFARTYEQNKLIDYDVDCYLCVSGDVKNKFIENYQIKSDKIYYKDSPIKVNERLNRRYSGNDEPLIIGYAGRLEKAQKRADLILPLIQSLEQLNIPYCFNIAGEGGFYHKLEEFINGSQLTGKVKLYGTLPFEQMKDFWLQCDVMVNLSDIEGIGLSMLEAMSVGTVPIVTDTAGAKSFIDNGVNGFVNNCGDILAIAKCIRVLSEDRSKLSEFGDISKNRIINRCNPKEYIEFLDNLID